MKYIYPIIISFLFNQTIEVEDTLYPDEIIEINNIIIGQNSEAIAHFYMDTNTAWSQDGSESSTLTLFINSIDSMGYSQDIVLYNGGEVFPYSISLGRLNQGTHTFYLKFDANKSTLGAETIFIDSIEIQTFDESSEMYNIIKYSPILYGRNIFSWNESTHTDIPLVMFHDSEISHNPSGIITQNITYSIIFSNEDSRIGIGLSDMMLSWARTTDIEWMYTASLILSDSNGIIMDTPQITNEYFQGASHITTEFNGNKFQDTHPILINATANCNFSDNGTSQYKFFLPPILSPDTNHTREFIMDQNPWTYKIMGQELENEDKYELMPNPDTYEMSDIRNYLYMEYSGTSNVGTFTMPIAAQLLNECQTYFYNDHNLPEMTSSFSSGVHRTAIELPQGFNPELITTLTFFPGHVDGFWTPDTIGFIDDLELFYVNNDFEIVDIETIWDFIPDHQLVFHNTTGWHSLIINQLFYENGHELISCGGYENPDYYCDLCNDCVESENPNCIMACDGNYYNDDNYPIIDDCGVCGGYNEDQDECGICFGNNESCSGCTDENASNYDEEATFDNGSCEYENLDNILVVPHEFSTIQAAIQVAQTGDEVLVHEGEYHENINLLGKSILLHSLSGAENTSIIGDSTMSVIICNSGESSETIIDGFTISGGYGMGVSFEDFISNAADPDAFEDMVVNQMMAGGISCLNSSPTLQNLIIIDNISRNVAGGIGLVNSNAIIDNVVVENNLILDGDALGGGGIALNGGMATISNSTIRNNYVGTNLYQVNGGGGILCGFTFNSSLSIDLYNVIIDSNTANIGAGIGALSGSIFMNKCIISNNIGEFGSTISLGEPLGLVINDINATIVNSTLVDNQGAISIGMINSSELNIVNTILWNENALQITNLPNNNILNTNISYSTIYNGWDGLNNLSSNPLFDNSSYNLSSSSPCIDTGTDYWEIDDSIILNLSPQDYYGDNPDIGFHEYGLNIQQPGDLNNDGIIDILDIMITVNITMGFIEPSTEQLLMSDLNSDGITDILDIMLLINIILNN